MSPIIDVMAERIDEVITDALLDVHAPMAEITCRVRGSSDGWYDSECRSDKRRARGLQRLVKRSRTGATRDNWMGAFKAMHHLVRNASPGLIKAGPLLEVTGRHSA